MHYCPDCGKECNCACDWGSMDEACEHICKTPEEIDYDQDVSDGMFEDDIFYDEDY